MKNCRKTQTTNRQQQFSPKISTNLNATFIEFTQTKKMILGHGNEQALHTNLIADFSSNVWYEGPNKDMIIHLQKELFNIKNYPQADADSFCRHLARYAQVERQAICATNGTVEAIYMLARIFAHKKSYIQTPTFSEYADACHREKHTVKYYKSFEQLTPEDNHIVWVCNPNNPTGHAISKNNLTQKITEFPKVTFIVDEAYSELCTEDVSCIDKTALFNNLIIIKSFTKTFSIPGLRLGYIVAPTQIAKQINALAIPWQVNSLALSAGKFILKQYQELLPCRKRINDEMNYFANELKKIPHIKKHPSSTNFMLCSLKTGNACFLKQQLMKNYGILIRSAHNFKGLEESYFRISLQEKNKIHILINALQNTQIHGKHLDCTTTANHRLFS